MGQSGIMNKIPGLIRYCESELPNEHCPYINLGCMGCLAGFYSDLAKNLQNVTKTICRITSSTDSENIG